MQAAEAELADLDKLAQPVTAESPQGGVVETQQVTPSENGRGTSGSESPSPTVPGTPGEVAKHLENMFQHEAQPWGRLPSEEIETPPRISGSEHASPNRGSPPSAADDPYGIIESQLKIFCNGK